MAYDILITGGTLIDGTGGPKFEADIGIEGGVIKDIGLLGGKEAKQIIPAAGKFVTPGFVDITNHSDSNGSLLQEPRQEASLTQGVTTIVVGNCGISLAPLASPEAVRALGKWQDISTMNVNWTSMGEFLDELARHPLGVNVATLVGHNTVRRGVIGGEVRTLSPVELAKVQYLIESGIEEGAFGFSASLINSHEQVATTEELIAMARSVAGKGGIFKIHLRNESRNLLASVNEAILIGREAKAPVIISHMKAIGRMAWPFYPKAIKMLERAREDGIVVSFDVFPYARTGSFLYQLLPGWARKGGFSEMFQRFRDADMRRKILDYLRPETFRFEKIIIVSSENSTINGKTIQEIAESSGRPSEEAFLDIILESEGRAAIFGRTLSVKNMMQGLAVPLSAVASDGGGVSREFRESGKLAHPRSFGTFTHFLHRVVRDKGLMSWEEGVRKITSFPADMVGIKNRGKIQKKNHADLVVFNPNTLCDQATYQNPYLVSKGVEWVLVNGRVALAGGKLVNIAGGQVLRK